MTDFVSVIWKSRSGVKYEMAPAKLANKMENKSAAHKYLHTPKQTLFLSTIMHQKQI